MIYSAVTLKIAGNVHICKFVSNLQTAAQPGNQVTRKPVGTQHSHAAATSDLCQGHIFNQG